MAYDLADLQSRIPFAVRRTWETGLPSFGEKLKVEREKRKITLEQISASTKIGTRMLQSLEEDKFNQLPGGIFNKGFVRAYSRCVGLDEDQTVADYLQASGDAPPVSTEIVAREDADRESAENIRRLEAVSDAPVRSLPWGLFAALLLIVALALSFWSYHRRDNTKPSTPFDSRPARYAPFGRTDARSRSKGRVGRAHYGALSGSEPDRLRRNRVHRSHSCPGRILD